MEAKEKEDNLSKPVDVLIKVSEQQLPIDFRLPTPLVCAFLFQGMRLLANLCVHSAVAPHISAADDTLDILLRILGGCLTIWIP